MWRSRAPASPAPRTGRTVVTLRCCSSSTGNGEVVADYVPEFADAFASIGFDTFFAEYRGYGGSTGTPGLVRMLDDVAPILDSLGVPEDRLVLYGAARWARFMRFTQRIFARRFVAS